MSGFNISDIAVGTEAPLSFILGPCQIESLDHARMMAEKIAAACEGAGVRFVYKSSYDKANRSSLTGARGVGMEEGLTILSKIRDEFGVPVLTDVHDASQCAPTAQAVDVVQIPALLCRQTDLLLAAGETGAAINVKKGQFLAPWDMANVAAKIASTGNNRIMLCERGTSFGYNTLVTDMRGLPQMAQAGYPVVFDATHSVQQPGGLGHATGGDRTLAPVLARAAVSVGVSMVFMETHQDPDNAPCDGPNMIKVQELQSILDGLRRYDALTRELALKA